MEMAGVEPHSGVAWPFSKTAAGTTKASRLIERIIDRVQRHPAVCNFSVIST
jgi:hypothetical protein